MMRLKERYAAGMGIRIWNSCFARYLLQTALLRAHWSHTTSSVRVSLRVV